MRSQPFQMSKSANDLGKSLAARFYLPPKGFWSSDESRGGRKEIVLPILSWQYRAAD